MRGSDAVRVFVSYAWTSTAHQEWVLTLARRLQADGIHVVIDRWDLKPGQDKYAFMERMVTDATVKRVLIVCDSGYQMRADHRTGGVGSESQLISPEIYEKVDQEKFIPVVAERDANGEPCLPAFIRTRVYFDLSSEDMYEQEYQRLLRHLYDRPEEVRPPLGQPPTSITQAEMPLPASVTLLPRTSPSSGSGMPGGNLRFLQQFVRDLEGFRFAPEQDEALDDTTLRLIEQMRPLRDAFIAFANQVAQGSLNRETLDQLRDHLEMVAQYQFVPRDMNGPFRETDWDHYRFFCYEIVLYLVALLLRSGRFSEAAELAQATYFYQLYGQTQHQGTSLFNLRIPILDNYRNHRLQLQRISVTADTVKARSEGSGVPFMELVDADLILHYLSLLRSDPGVRLAARDVWWPRLSVYAPYRQWLPIFDKLISRRQFERVKPLFGVATPDALRSLITAHAEQLQRYSHVSPWEYEIPVLSAIINLDTIATVP